MTAMRRWRYGLLTLGALVAGSILLAQPGASRPAGTPPPTPKSEKVIFSTQVGSFRIMAKGDDKPFGALEMRFKGTVLVSGLEGPIETSPGVKREYHDEKHQKSVYFGDGTLKLNGKFLSIQWFGRDMSATFDGDAVMHLYGEYDKNLKTGTYAFAAEPNVKKDWGTNGVQVVIPRGPGYGPKVESRERTFGQ